MRKIYSFNEVLVVIFVIGMFFSGFLKTSVSNIFGYIDEILVIFFIVIYMLKILLKKKRKITKESLIIIANSMLLIIIGFIGNLVSEYQNSTGAIIIDMFSWLKFFGTFALLYEIININKIEKYFKLMDKLAKFFVILGYIIYVLILIGKIFAGSRYGIQVFYLGGHPSFACAFYATIISFLMHDHKKNIIWIILAMILELLTLRSKAFGFCFLVVLLVIFLRKKISFNKIFIAMLGVVFFVWERISYYFLDVTASRAVALITSFKIFKNFFPIGSGFATYGTVMSGTFYSKAYYIYGLSNRWGFSTVNSSFIGDGGLATIIGQFGFIGCLIFLVNIIILVEILIKLVKRYDGKIIDIIALVGYIGISCTNEIFFNSDIAVIFAIVLVILIKKYIVEEETEKKNYE